MLVRFDAVTFSVCNVAVFGVVCVTVIHSDWLAVGTVIRRDWLGLRSVIRGDWSTLRTVIHCVWFGATNIRLHVVTFTA